MLCCDGAREGESLMVRRAIPLVSGLIAPCIAITLPMSGDCINGGYCSWGLYHPTQGFRDIVIFNTTSADIWDVYSFHTIALHNWRAGATETWLTWIVRTIPRIAMYDCGRARMFLRAVEGIVSVVGGIPLVVP
jgi:hypothetical protein